MGVGRKVLDSEQGLQKQRTKRRQRFEAGREESLRPVFSRGLLSKRRELWLKKRISDKNGSVRVAKKSSEESRDVGLLQSVDAQELER